MHHRKLSEIVQDQDLLFVDSGTAVTEAARLMTDRNVAAILIIDAGELKGIFTERDMVRRIVAVGRNPNETSIGEAMTHELIALDGERLGFEAVCLMIEMGVRHVVVTGLAKAPGCGVVSIRDFAIAELASFEKEIEQEEHLWSSI